MKPSRIRAYCSFLLALCCSAVLAQPSGSATQIYAAGGIGFEYGQEWKLADKSTPVAQHLLLKRDGSSALIMVLAYRTLIVSPEQLAAARREVTEVFVDEATRKLGGNATVKREDAELKVGIDQALGTRLHGTISQETATAEIYSYVAKLRFITLAYIRPDREGSQVDPAWTTLLHTFKVDIPLIGSKEQGGLGQEFPEEYLQGRALSLPRPEYPFAARSNHISGTVIVKVIVDENGSVATVSSASGPPVLAKAAVKAAYGARFKPTQIAGQPVRVTGVITYKFVAQ